jgi:hypothetical protein
MNTLKTLKKIIWKIDSIAFNGIFNKFYLSRIVESRLAKHQSENINYGYTVQYKKNDQSEVNLLADKYGSDKGESTDKNNPYPWPSHNYADVYELMFRLRRNDVKLLVECGMGTNNPNLRSTMGSSGKPGASLRLWRDYFKNANIIGIDIDREILFQEDRITTFHCDQTSQKSISKFVQDASLGNASCDIIIDDGLHEFHAGKTLFEGLINFLTEDGIYVIEDVNHVDYISYKDYFLELSDIYSAHFFNLHRPSQADDGNNRLIVIRKNEENNF